MTKPFLLLQSRPEDPASDNEYEAFCTFAGLEPAQLVRVRMDQEDLPDVNLDDFSGVLMGGGPANLAYTDDQKTNMQKQFEPWLFELLRRIVHEDKPFLGACLGFGALVQLKGGTVSFDYPEDVGDVDVMLTEAGQNDPLLHGLPGTFSAFVGHKEGVNEMPSGVVELARSAACSQMLRIGQNVYGAQFHPELDAAGLALRIEVYKHAGYFPPIEADALIAKAWESDVAEPVKILHEFVKKYSV